MSRTYNVCMLTGLGLVSAGTALYSPRAGLIVCGALLIGLTFASVFVLKAMR